MEFLDPHKKRSIHSFIHSFKCGSHALLKAPQSVQHDYEKKSMVRIRKKKRKTTNRKRKDRKRRRKESFGEAEVLCSMQN